MIFGDAQAGRSAESLRGRDAPPLVFVLKSAQVRNDLGVSWFNKQGSDQGSTLP